MGDVMALEDLEKAAMDPSVSTREFFHIFLEDCDERDKQAKNTPVDPEDDPAIVGSRAFEKWQSDLNRARNTVKKHRPFVFYVLLPLHIAGQHWFCCGLGRYFRK